MLHFFPRIENKTTLVAPILLGVYVAVLYLFQSFIYDILFYRFGIVISNSYPGFTLFGLFLFVIPLAIGITRLLSKTILTYDKALLVGLAANYAFSLTLISSFTLFGTAGFSIIEFLGMLLFSFLFGFIFTALIAMAVDRVSLKYLNH